jgi:hypothetical protein
MGMHWRRRMRTQCTSFTHLCIVYNLEILQFVEEVAARNNNSKNPVIGSACCSVWRLGSPQSVPAGLGRDEAARLGARSKKSLPGREGLAEREGPSLWHAAGRHSMLRIPCCFWRCAAAASLLRLCNNSPHPARHLALRGVPLGIYVVVAAHHSAHSHAARAAALSFATASAASTAIAAAQATAAVLFALHWQASHLPPQPAAAAADGCRRLRTSYAIGSGRDWRPGAAPHLARPECSGAIWEEGGPRGWSVGLTTPGRPHCTPRSWRAARLAAPPSAGQRPAHLRPASGRLVCARPRQTVAWGQRSHGRQAPQGR